MAAADAVDVKVVVLGSSGAGKTCLVTRYVEDRWNDSPKPTVGAAFLLKVSNAFRGASLHVNSLI
jgi:GTPase SAR1 family protein